MFEKILPILAGVSTLSGLISIGSYYYYVLTAKKAERSVTEILSGKDISDSPTVIKVLKQFDDEENRLKALTKLLHYDRYKAKDIIDKIDTNIDVHHLEALTQETRRKLRLYFGIFMLLAAMIFLVSSYFPANENQPPTITSLPFLSLKVGQPFQYQVQASDPDDDVLVYQLKSTVAGITINSRTGKILWTPTEDHMGKHVFVLRVKDSHNNRDEQPFNLEVIRDHVAKIVIPKTVQSSIMIDRSLSPQYFKDPFTYEDLEAYNGDVIEWSLYCRGGRSANDILTAEYNDRECQSNWGRIFAKETVVALEGTSGKSHTTLISNLSVDKRVLFHNKSICKPLLEELALHACAVHIDLHRSKATLSHLEYVRAKEQRKFL